MLSAPGIGSGLDVDTIINQLLEVERIPVIQLEARRAENTIKISEYGALSNSLSVFKSSFSTLSNPDNFGNLVVTSSDQDVLTATALSSAGDGSNTIEVTALAKNHKLNSALFVSGEDEVVGTGTLTLSSGSDSFAVVVDNNNDTLAQVRDAINNNSGNFGVTASIINVTGGSRLILRADNAGAVNALEVRVSNDADGNDTDAAGLSQLVYEASGTQNLVQLEAAQDAALTVDGFNVSSASNQVSGVISGVTLNLEAIGTTQLDVRRDTSTLSTTFNKIVTDYNNLTQLITAARGSTLGGESFLVNLEAQVRNVFSSRISGLEGGLDSMFNLGLSFDKEGVMTFDSTKLNSFLDSNSESVKSLLSQEGDGIAKQMDTLLDSYLGTNGLIQGRSEAISNNSDFLAERIDSMNRQIDATEQRLLSQFTALDVLVGRLNNTSNFLTQQLSQFNNNRNS